MVQQLKVLAFLQRTLVWFLAPMWLLTVTPTPGDQTPFSTGTRQVVVCACVWAGKIQKKTNPKEKTKTSGTNTSSGISCLGCRRGSSFMRQKQEGAGGPLTPT